MDSPSQSMLLTSTIEPVVAPSDDSAHLKLLQELESDTEQLFQACAEILAYVNNTVQNKLDKYVQKMPPVNLKQLNDRLYAIDMKCDQLILQYLGDEPNENSNPAN